MKKIEAFIRPEKLDLVIDALERVGYPGISISDARGHGKQRGSKDQWHGQLQPKTFQPKLRLEIVAHDADANKIANAIVSAGQTPDFGAGKVFISSIEDAIRIRTTQRGEIALD